MFTKKRSNQGRPTNWLFGFSLLIVTASLLEITPGTLLSFHRTGNELMVLMLLLSVGITSFLACVSFPNSLSHVTLFPALQVDNLKPGRKTGVQTASCHVYGSTMHGLHAGMQLHNNGLQHPDSYREGDKTMLSQVLLAVTK